MYSKRINPVQGKWEGLFIPATWSQKCPYLSTCNEEYYVLVDISGRFECTNWRPYGITFLMCHQRPPEPSIHPSSLMCPHLRLSRISQGLLSESLTFGRLQWVFGGRQVESGSAQPLNAEAKVMRDLGLAPQGPCLTFDRSRVLFWDKRSRQKQMAAMATLVIEGCCYSS